MLDISQIWKYLLSQCANLNLAFRNSFAVLCVPEMCCVGAPVAAVSHAASPGYFESRYSDLVTSAVLDARYVV